MAELKKGTRLTYSTLLTIIIGLCVSPPVGWAAETIITRIRTGSEQAYVRVVIETNIQLEHRPKISADRNTLSISLENAKIDRSSLKSEAYRNDVINIDISRASAETHIDATLAFVPTRIRTFFLVKPNRFVIDAYRPSSKVTDSHASEALKPISIIEEKGIPLAEVTKKKSSPLNKEAGTFRNAAKQSDPSNGAIRESIDKGFQQRLLLFLIVVTSITLIVIILLMCMDKAKK